MSWGYVVVAGAALVTGYMSSKSQKDAGNDAASAQERSTDKGIAEQHRQFDAIQKLLDPYNKAGANAVSGQQDLIGLNGKDAQKAAITALQKSPQFTSMLQQGENSILQNASATGGLRGGNTQSALAQFSPQLLAQTINDQFGKLGSLTSVGENAAAMSGNAGMNAANQVTQLLQQQGAAQAGAILNQGNQNAQMWNTVGQTIGTFAGRKF